MIDKTQPPGIVFRGLVVDQIRFQDLPPGVPRPALLNYQIRVGRMVLDKVAEIALAIRVVDEQRVSAGTAGTPLDSAPFDGFLVEVQVTARFEPDQAVNFPLERFAERNAVPLIMPFAREAIARVTSTSRHGVVLLPPINVLALLDQQAAEEARAETAEPKS